MTRVNLISLTKTYTNQRIPVLKDFSLSVDDGEMVALLGPSGSGKSTLLKLIAGIERPEAGDIQFDNSSILSIPPNKRGAVFMFQKSYLFPFLNVAENIGFGLKVQGVPAETIRTEVARMLDFNWSARHRAAQAFTTIRRGTTARGTGKGTGNQSQTAPA